MIKCHMKALALKSMNVGSLKFNLSIGMLLGAQTGKIVGSVPTKFARSFRPSKHSKPTGELFLSGLYDIIFNEREENMTERERADLVVRRTFGIADDAELTESKMQNLREYDDACMRFFNSYLSEEANSASKSSI